MSNTQPVLLGGAFVTDPAPEGEFGARAPSSGKPLAGLFPISGRPALEQALAHAQSAARALRSAPSSQIAEFLELCAENLGKRADALVEAAHEETGLPAEPRLRTVELPRTQGQLRQAAQAARTRSFTEPTIDTKAGLCSMRAALGGPVVVFGPNNFPFAFNAVMGGDFAAALAAGNPVIAKGHPSHPRTTQLLAEAALEALAAAGLPRSAVQLLYALPKELGLELVGHPSVAAVAFTGSRAGGLALKQAADAAGKPIYLEMAAVNPVFFLPGALAERLQALASELAGSITLGAGQFCTKPGLSIVVGPRGEGFVEQLSAALRERPAGLLLSAEAPALLSRRVGAAVERGAKLECGGKAGAGPGFSFEPTLLSVSAEQFLQSPAELQHESFGPVHLVVRAAEPAAAAAVCETLEGSLTGAIYSATEGAADGALYDQIAAELQLRVGRLLNDKMPTGVAVSAAMNHGGPYPATGHPGFSSVGLPGSIARFTALRCYDAVRAERLPEELQPHNPLGVWRSVDGSWTQEANPSA